MTHPTRLPILAGLAIVGTALSVHLGRSAIAEIDPAYFRDPEVPFHADLVPHRGPDWAQVQVREYQQAGLNDGLGDGCVGCRDYPEEYVPQPDPAVEGDGGGWAAGSAQPAEAVFVEEPARESRWERVERYASYPVSAEEEAADPAAEEAVAYAATE